MAYAILVGWWRSDLQQPPPLYFLYGSTTYPTLLTGILNTPNCGYDGGDCCAYSCRKGSTANLAGNETVINLEEIYKWTNDSVVVAELVTSEYGTNSSIDYSYSCAPASFVCLDPVAANASLTCDAALAPVTDTYKNASCGNFELDPRFGDGFCDPDLNYQECRYDGGDCCARTCRLNRFVPGGCSPASLQNCRDPGIGDRALAYINPPKVNRECHPFIYDSGLSKVRQITKVNAAITPCDQRDINVTEVGEFVTPGSSCPGNFSIRRVWRITDTNTSTSAEQEQLITVSATVASPYNARPLSLWRRTGTASSLDTGRYSLGVLQTSPFFYFSKPSFCTGAISVAFVSCTNATDVQGASQCVYNAATDEVALVSPQDGDLWNVNARLTDACGLTSVVSSPVFVSESSNGTMPATININGSVFVSLDTSLVCKHNAITTRLPSPENKQSRGQVCTQVFAEDLPAPALYTISVLDSHPLPSVHVCLRTTRKPPQCADSATSGRLRAVFFDTRDFGIEHPDQIGVISSTIKVASLCSSLSTTGAGNLSSCSGWRARNEGDQDTRQYNLAFEVADTRFDSLTGETDVGCFFLQAANITAPKTSWDTGFVYSNVSGDPSTTSTMVGQVCAADPVPIPSLVNVERRVVSTRIPPSRADGSDVLVCISVDSPVLVDLSTVSVCMATTTQYPGCQLSASTGRLDRLFLEGSRFGTLDPDLFNFESGPLVRISRPYCTRHPDNGTQVSLDCTRQGIADPPPVLGTSVTVALPVSNVTWASSDQPLGCFYVTTPNLFTAQNFSSIQFKNWAFAFHFSGVGAGAANVSMAGMAFSDPVPADAPSTATTCAINDVTIRVPQGDDQGSTSQVRSRET